MTDDTNTEETPEETPASAPEIPDTPTFHADETHPLWAAILAELRQSLPEPQPSEADLIYVARRIYEIARGE